MTSKNLIALSVITGAVIVMGARFFWLTPAPISVPEIPDQKVKTVIFIDEGGFQPVNLEIKIGEKVTFVNRGQKPHWPASDIHPTHQIYPEFDPQKPVPPGEKWSFAFNKSGAWKFHDHLSARLTGKIIVKPSSEAEVKKEPLNLKSDSKLTPPAAPLNIETLLASIDMLLTAKNETDLLKWLKIAGPQKLMEDLLNDSGGGAQIDCHQQAHNIGRLAYKLYGALAFKNSSPACHSGYYHGAIESFLQENSTDNIAQKAETLCDVFDTGFGRFECLHGLGHGILAYENYDLPKAIAVCGELGSDYNKNSCIGGMFMENIVTGQGLGAGNTHETAWVNRTDPHFPCNALDQNYDLQYQCYQMQTSWMLYLFNYDFNRVKEECPKARPDMVPVCFKSFGRDAAGHTLRNVPKIVEICGKIMENDEYYNQCVIGAVNVIVDFWGGGLRGQATELCQALPDKSLPAGRQGKLTCYSTLSGRLNDIFKTESEKQSICAGFEENYKNLCSS